MRACNVHTGTFIFIYAKIYDRYVCIQYMFVISILEPQNKNSWTTIITTAPWQNKHLCSNDFLNNVLQLGHVIEFVVHWIEQLPDFLSPC